MSKSKRHVKNLALVATATKKSQILEIKDAVELLSSLEQPKFKDGVTLELHVKLNINPTKSDQLVRSSVVLPHGTGKHVKIAAFVTDAKAAEAKKAGAEIVGGDELIEEIKKSEKINFDIAVAEPEMMKKLPVIARILGVAGVMPNPKTNTVGEDVTAMIEPLMKGKINFKNDKTGNIHVICGKLNAKFTPEQLVENVKEALAAVEKSKPEVIKKKFVLTAHLATSMSPSIRII
jgi:large subunit ribosomal protein L1